MPRWVVAVLGAGVVAGIAVLVWQLRAEPNRPKRGGIKAPVTAPGQQTPAKRAAFGNLPADDDDDDHDDAGEALRRKSIDEVGLEYKEKLLSRTVPNQIMRAVAGCYSDEPDTRETMRMTFTVEFNEDVGMISNAKVTRSIGYPGIDECAVDVVNALTWRQPRAPNFSHDDDVEITINDLVKRHKQFERRDQEE